MHAIIDYPPPKNAKQVKQILGSFNFYRKFIPNFSKHSKCLTDLTRKDVPFIWTDECQRNFQILKDKLLTAPITAFPQFETNDGKMPEFIVSTDASGEALAAILSQIQDGKERLISCIGRNMLPAETRYSTHEKEALAIFYAFKKFDSYLRYAHTTVYTDCSSLKSILKRPGNPVSPRIARYVYALTAYDYDIIYRKGALNHCDAYSRFKYPQNLKQEDVEPNTYPFMSSILPQTQTFSNTCDLTNTAGSDSKVHVVDNERPTQAERGMSPANDKTRTVYAHCESGLDTAMLSDEVNCNHVASATETSLITDTTNANINEIIVDNTDDEAKRAHKHATPSDDDNFPYGTKLTIEMVANEQRLDRKLSPLIKYLDEGILPNDDKLARKILLFSANYNYTDGLLYHQQASRARNINHLHIQLVIPDNLRAVVLKEFHDNLGHRGKVNTFYNIRNNYYWENMFKDISDYIKSCRACMLHKNVQKKDRAPLSPVQTPNGLFQHFFFDILGPFKTTKRGYTYVLTCIDAFSKMVELIPLRNVTAHTVAEAIFERIICTFGCFQTISTDRGTQFTNCLMKELNALTGSKHIFATTAHHAAVGQVERTNQSVERILAKYVNFDRNDWDNSLSLAKYAINISVADATGLSPYVVTYGREPKTALDVALRKPDNIPPNMENDFRDLVERVTLLNKIVKENSELTKIKMKEYYDKQSTEVKFKIGQLVLLQLQQNLSSGKLATQWDGPYRIVATLGHNFKLRRISDGEILPLPVHPNRLQPFYDRQLDPPVPPSHLPNTANENQRPSSDSFTTTQAHDEAISAPPNTSGSAINAPQSAQPKDVKAHLSVTAARKSPLSPTDESPNTQQKHHHTSPGADNRDQSAGTQSRLPRPGTNSNESTDRDVHNITKARKTKNGLEYYIIYEDQINKDLGLYVPENKLTPTERAYIDLNKDKIRVMRHQPKININNISLHDNNQYWSPWFELKI